MKIVNKGKGMEDAALKIAVWENNIERILWLVLAYFVYDSHGIALGIFVAVVGFKFINLEFKSDSTNVEVRDMRAEKRKEQFGIGN